MKSVVDGAVDRLAKILEDHEADVTSYDAADIHGCRCRDFEIDPAVDYMDRWTEYHKHVARVIVETAIREEVE